MGAQWSELPDDVKAILVATSSKVTLKDQTFSNMIYGLSLLGVEWQFLEEELRDNLLQALDDDDTFTGNVPQHVANSIWGLAKMDASWTGLPWEKLSVAFKRVAPYLKAQEVSNRYECIFMLHL
jgi:hypothetical protein